MRSIGVCEWDASVAAAILTLVIAFLCGGGLWLVLGPRFALSDDSEQNDVLNLLVYIGGLVPVAFVLVFFLLEAV